MQRHTGAWYNAEKLAATQHFNQIRTDTATDMPNLWLWKRTVAARQQYMAQQYRQ